MTWDITTPAGSEAKSNGDNRIRELKEDIQTSLRADDADGDEAKFPGSDTSNPIYRYRGLKGTTAARPTAGQYGLYFDTDKQVLYRDNGSSWDAIGDNIESGTKMVFYQAAVPTGWTQDTSHDDKTLRVVSGSGGGSGGTHAMSDGLSHSHTVASHTHSIANEAAHTHAISEEAGAATLLGSGSSTYTGTHDHTGLTGSDGDHDHGGATGAASPGTSTDAPTLQYVDVVLGTKD